MAKPKVAATSPNVVDLEPGDYWYCACGESSDGTFCDGTHKVKGEFSPIKFTVEEPRKSAVCRCKQTGGAPFCDGSHQELP